MEPTPVVGTTPEVVVTPMVEQTPIVEPTQPTIEENKPFVESNTIINSMSTGNATPVTPTMNTTSAEPTQTGASAPKKSNVGLIIAVVVAIVIVVGGIVGFLFLGKMNKPSYVFTKVVEQFQSGIVSSLKEKKQPVKTDITITVTEDIQLYSVEFIDGTDDSTLFSTIVAYSKKIDSRLFVYPYRVKKKFTGYTLTNTNGDSVDSLANIKQKETYFDTVVTLGYIDSPEQRVEFYFWNGSAYFKNNTIRAWFLDQALIVYDVLPFYKLVRTHAISLYYQEIGASGQACE
jgi:hypothetical protein